MDFGAVLFSKPDSYKEAIVAERLGFSHAWLYDSQLLCADPYAALALCALKTTKIFLGTGVTNPSSRISPVTACAIATINALAPGRVILGIGTGNTARRTLGMPPARLDAMREHIAVCRGLLAGKTVPYHEGGRHRMITFLNPKSGWINIRKKIPIYVAASGAKSLETAGEIADGVILFGAVGPSLIDFVLDHLRAGAERAGRDPRKIYTLCMTAFHLTRPGEKLETAAVRRAVGPFVASSTNIYALAAQSPAELPADLRDDIVKFAGAYKAPDAPVESRHLKLYEGYNKGFRKEHESLVTERMIRATTLTGTQQEVLDAVAAMRRAGIRQVAIQPVTDAVQSLKIFASKIIRKAG